MRINSLIVSSIGSLGIVLLCSCGGISGSAGGDDEGGGGTSSGGTTSGGTTSGGTTSGGTTSGGTTSGGTTSGGTTSGGTGGGGGGSTLSFATNIAPILNAHCTGCHGGGSPSAGLSLTTYANTMTVVTAFNAPGSKLIQKINPGGPMAPYITSADRTTVTTWVTQGALP